MTDAYRKAGVFVQNRFAGVLEETEEGYLFSYAQVSCFLFSMV